VVVYARLSSTEPPPAGLPAGGRVAEKPHQGVRDPNATLHQAIAFSKPLTASGLPAFVYDSGRRSRCSGKERDSETGNDYFGARYFSGAQGRFTSDDPLNIPGLQRLNPQQFEGIIADPQNWNGYAYARNNPLTHIDPDGFLTVIVPGTWNDNQEWKKSRFRAQVSKTFGEDAVVLDNNNMGNSKKARSEAAKKLQALIANHKFAPGEKLNVVAHSHGGNVVAEASQSGISHKIDNLVTLGTPIRSDYSFNESAIGLHLNVFSNKDKVQAQLGGAPDPFSFGGIPGAYGSTEAQRTIDAPGVRNLDATSQAAGHSELWTKPGTWDKIVAPELKK
jgi:RHS repeat-associated protein